MRAKHAAYLRSFGVRWRLSHRFGSEGGRCDIDPCLRRARTAARASHSAGIHDSTSLPERRLDTARTPKCCALKRCFDAAQSEANFAKLWSAVATEPPLWE